jgi:hypothetical protein
LLFLIAYVTNFLPFHLFARYFLYNKLALYKSLAHCLLLRVFLAVFIPADVFRISVQTLIIILCRNIKIIIIAFYNVLFITFFNFRLIVNINIIVINCVYSFQTDARCYRVGKDSVFDNRRVFLHFTDFALNTLRHFLRVEEDCMVLSLDTRFGCCPVSVGGKNGAEGRVVIGSDANQ